MKKILMFTLSLIIVLNACVLNIFFIYGENIVDDNVYEYKVKNIYNGTKNGSILIKNLQFNDIKDHWAAKNIVKVGSLGMIKGYGENFRPNNFVTNQEAIIFIIRLMGIENEVEVRDTGKNEDNIDKLSIAYIELALKKGLINRNQYASLLSGNESINLNRNANVTREQIATWLGQGLILAGSEDIDLNKERQKVFSFLDWSQIEPSYLPYIEAITSSNIMVGDSLGNFNPKSFVTRAEMATILSNMDNIYYKLKKIEKKAGTVVSLKDDQKKTTQSGSICRNFYIRDLYGNIDVIKYEFLKTSSPQDGVLDIPVFKNGKVESLISVYPGDEIEYLIFQENNDALYINVLGSGIKKDFIEGQLFDFNSDIGTITIKDDKGKSYTYQVINSIYDTIDGKVFITIGDKKLHKENIPLGSRVKLEINNNIVHVISFLGMPIKDKETRGIVLENNIKFGYLVFIDESGHQITKNYFSKDMKVQKQEHYQKEDNIGYLSEMFPNFKYNPKDTLISSIEPGDIIFMRFDPKDENIIINISASPNYISKYGSIKQINKSNDNIMQILVEDENGQTIWYQIPNNIFISKAGKPFFYKDIKEGDFLKLLINQAIIDQGYIMESVKEITLEDDSHHISDIIKGQISGLNIIQNEIIIQNAQKLTKIGWDDYKQLSRLNISPKMSEYYNGSEKISLDYISKFLKRTNGDVYIAIDKNSTGQKVSKITFREGRDELLNPDKVIKADGIGSFSITSNNGDIKTDRGTIVRKNGRLVDGVNIKPSDYAMVSLNGGNNAAVVDIFESPSYKLISIARGRIASINDRKSFKVQSMAMLSDNDWIYTPVEREFTIDYNTLFLDKKGYVDPKTFLDYTKTSSIDKVYNIIYDGSKATHVIDSPYSNKAVRGIIYNVGDKFVEIKNAKYYDSKTGKWLDVSRNNNILSIELFNNTTIIKTNSVVQPKSLVSGDEIRVMTDNIPEKMSPGNKIQGYIVVVEK